MSAVTAPSRQPCDFKSVAAQMVVDVLRAYYECGDEMQEAIHDMIDILKDPDAVEEDKRMAHRTIQAILFPTTHNGALGVDIEEVKCLRSKNPDVRAVLDAMKNEEATFAQRLSSLMEVREITQSQLADQIGVGQPAVSMMLSRNCRPQKRTVEKIAEVLKVSAEELWPGLKED